MADNNTRCECEHVKHIAPCKNPREVKVYTDYGWYNVCLHCANEHLNAQKSESGIYRARL